MYEDFFGLQEKPFSIQPDPDFLYWGSAHSLAIAMLKYGLMNRAGFTVITGEVGTGKTTLVRHLLNNIDRDINVGLISHTRKNDSDLLQWIMMAFDQPFEGLSYVALTKRFQDYLIDQYAKNGRTILIIDEGQNLGINNLEELRTLSNINADKHQLLQLILLGQPQLKEMLKNPDMIQFSQRVSSDFHIRPLTSDESSAYIDHRLKVAGSHSDLFTPEAKFVVFKASRGIPRSINILCDTALVYAYASETKTIDSPIMELVLADKNQYGVFPIEGARDWPRQLQEVSS